MEKEEAQTWGPWERQERQEGGLALKLVVIKQDLLILTSADSVPTMSYSACKPCS